MLLVLSSPPVTAGIANKRNDRKCKFELIKDFLWQINCSSLFAIYESANSLLPLLSSSRSIGASEGGRRRGEEEEERGIISGTSRKNPEKPTPDENGFANAHIRHALVSRTKNRETNFSPSCFFSVGFRWQRNSATYHRRKKEGRKNTCLLSLRGLFSPVPLNLNPPTKLASEQPFLSVYVLPFSPWGLVASAYCARNGGGGKDGGRF